MTRRGKIRRGRGRVYVADGGGGRRQRGQTSQKDSETPYVSLRPFFTEGDETVSDVLIQERASSGSRSNEVES